MHWLSRVALAAAALLGCGVAACGGPSWIATPAPAGMHECDGDELGSVEPPPEVRFVCTSLAVPLDHGLRPGPRDGRLLSLPVAMTDNATAPRGALVWMTGGPGGPGVLSAGEVASQLDPAVLRDYRLVMFSQRGTGPTALRCPRLQKEMLSALQAPPVGAVEDCAREIGPDRRFFSTADTVADLERVRELVGADRLTLIGASYGTLAAARYAVVHPDRVSHLVLDSVVPHDGLDPLMLDLFPRAADLLRQTCARTGCPSDPAADLTEVVRTRHNGPELLSALTSLSAKPRLTDLIAALREAVQGDGDKLDDLLAARRKEQGSPPRVDEYSRGLNVTTSCQDMQGPWGGASATPAARAESARAAVDALPDQAFFPFDRATALENGTSATCQRWPETAVAPFPVGRDLPPVPTLLLAGERDLTTPLAWTQREAARAPNGRLAVVPGAGHITQNTADYGTTGRDLVTQFLTTDGQNG